MTREEHATARYALALDIGGTLLRVGLVDRSGRVAHRETSPTLADQGRDAVLDRLVALVERVASRVERSSLVGVGVSMASPIEPDTGKVHNPPNLPGWDGFALKPELERRLSLPVSAANDATLGALAEHVYGAGRDFKHLIYITVSTGIGGGVVVDGRLYTGYRGFAGEVGHITVDRNGPVCNCGNVGCLEVVASGTAVAREARRRLELGAETVLRERSGPEPDNVDARMVAEAAIDYDEVSQGIMRDAARNLGIGIVSLLHAFDPEAIIIGGGMSANLERLMLPEIAQEIGRHAMAHQRDRVPVIKSGLGDDVSLIGAAALAFDADRRGQKL